MRELDQIRSELRAMRLEIEPHQAAVEQLLGQRSVLVDEARRKGMTWVEVGSLCGVTHQALIYAQRAAQRRSARQTGDEEASR